MDPWYEMTGPGLDEVIKIVKSHKHFKEIDVEKYNDLIEDVIDKEYIKYSGFGSYRGFYTFTLNTLVNDVEKAILNKIKYKISFRRLTHSIMIKNWVNHVLYRLPEPNSNEKMGLRVGYHKTNFNEYKTNSNSRIV